VINIQKTKQGLIWHEFIKSDGETQSARYFQICGGLSWPNDYSSAFHVFLSEDFIGWPESGEKAQRGKLRLLSECLHDNASIDEIFQKLSDDAVRLHAEWIYTNVDGEQYADLVTACEEYRYDNKIRLGSLKQAPFAETSYIGASLVLNWLKSGRFDIPPVSIVFDQLKQFSIQDFGDRPDEKFYAINALRHCVSGFQKYAPSRPWRRHTRTNAMAV
jgi:hypothetical protein